MIQIITVMILYYLSSFAACIKKMCLTTQYKHGSENCKRVLYATKFNIFLYLDFIDVNAVSSVKRILNY